MLQRRVSKAIGQMPEGFGVVSREEIIAAIEKEWRQPWQELRKIRGKSAEAMAIWFTSSACGFLNIFSLGRSNLGDSGSQSRIFGFDGFSSGGIDKLAINIQPLRSRKECLRFRRQPLFRIMRWEVH